MPIRTFHSRLERLRKMKPAPVLLVYFFHALGCAIALQCAARKARREAISELQANLNEVKFSQPTRSEQIEYLIDRIESVQQGAFKPFLQNPVVHVILGSGGGLLTLLKFFPIS